VAQARGFGLWLFGAAGSGKSTLGEQLAQALELELFVQPLCMTKYDLLGSCTADGTFQHTPCTYSFEHGGFLLLDEVDAYLDEARLAINSATANGFCAFPGRPHPVKRHADWFVCGTSNTMYGATSVYPGRTAPDGAFLDRFLRLEVSYDAALEMRMAEGNTAWVATVQRLRDKARDAGLSIVISPRASNAGAAMLLAGLSEREALEATILCGLPHEARQALGV
jgi:MoxR-like ATPase